MCHSLLIIPSPADRICRGLFLSLGWVVFGLLAYKVATTKIDNKIYDPFEILGIKSVSVAFIANACFGFTHFRPHYQCCGYLVSYMTFIFRVLRKKTSNPTIKSSPKYCMFLSHHLPRRIAHYLHSHPDKVKLTANDTAESVAARFVELTKAYKAYAAIRPELIWSDLVPGLLMRTSGKISRNMDTRMAGKKSRWVLHFPGGSWRRIIISGCLPFTGVYLASASPLPWYVFSLELRIGVWVETFSCILGKMVVRITPENQGWCFYSDCDQLLEGTH